MPDDFTYVWNLENKISRTETDLYREQFHGHQMGEESGDGFKR